MNREKIGFLLNSNMKFGIDEFEKLPAYLKEMNFSNIAVIIDQAIMESGYIKNVFSGMQQSF